MAFFFCFFFNMPFIFHRASFLSPLLVVTQIRGHVAGSSPPSPVRFVPCIFIARRLWPLLLSPTRALPPHATSRGVWSTRARRITQVAKFGVNRVNHPISQTHSCIDVIQQFKQTMCEILHTPRTDRSARSHTSNR